MHGRVDPTSRATVLIKKYPHFPFPESEKFHEMEAATELPPQQCFLLDDDGEFPPMK